MKLYVVVFLPAMHPSLSLSIEKDAWALGFWIIWLPLWIKTVQEFLGWIHRDATGAAYTPRLLQASG